MKVAYAEKHIVASQGIVKQSGFRMHASAEAYKILSDGLYSDKQTAVLREIGCNAHDAHVAAGTPNLPIEVKLPTSLSPDMYIKDFGPGLSDLEVRGDGEVGGLYTTYFGSDKQDSDDLIGGFGLGSKSPYSYTDSFTVVSAKDGVERTYTATIDDEGLPVMALMHEKPATPEWPHGVTVGFAVPPRDFAEFERKAREVFQWFTVKPTIAGISAERLTPRFKVDTPTFSFNGKNEAALACIIMGNVRYPLDASKLGFTATTALDQLALSLLAQGIHLRLRIGTVKPAASREQLQYDKSSKPALIEALRAAAQEFARMVNEVARAPAANEWEKHVSCQQFIAGFTSEMRVVVEQAIRVGEKDEELAKRAKLLFSGQAVALPKEAGEAHEGKHFTVMGYHRNEKLGSASRKSIYGGGYYRGSERSAFAVSYLSGFTIFVNDAKYSDTRMRKLVSHTLESALMITPGEGSTVEDAMAYAELLSAKMGCAPVSTVSTLPEPIKQPRVKRAHQTKAPVVASKGRVNVIYVGQSFSRRYEEPTLNPEPLNTVVDEAKYFVIKGTGSGSNSSYLLTPGYKVTTGCASVKNPGLQHLVKGIQALNAICTEHEMPSIRGFLVVSESAVKRMKLEELGFKPLVPAAHALTHVPAVAAAVEKGTRGLPYLGGSDFAHPTDCIVSAVRNERKYVETVRRVMQGKPMETLLLEELPLVTGSHVAVLRSRIAVLNQHFSELQLSRIEISKVELTLEGVRKMFNEAFPLVTRVTPAQFQTSLIGGAVDEVFLQQVLITQKDIELIQALKSQQATDSFLLKAAA